MTDKILYRVLCDEYEEVARIFFEIKETGEQIEGSHQIQKWINNVFNENEQLKQLIKGQELEIVRLHHLADAMSGVLRELGIYDVYNQEQINKVKKELQE